MNIIEIPNDGGIIVKAEEKTHLEKLKEEVIYPNSVQWTHEHVLKETCEAILKDIDEFYKGRYIPTHQKLVIELIKKGLK